MDEDGTTTEVQQAPPVVDWESADNPYRERFDNYRREADRRATESQQRDALLADLQSDDPGKQAAAAAALGFELAAEDPEDTDPLAELEQRFERQYGSKITQLEQRLSEQAQRDEAAGLADAISQRLDTMGVKDTSEGDLVIAMALRLPALEDGLPDLKGAYDMLQKRDQDVVERYRTTKRSPALSSGQTGSEVKNILDMTDNERLDYVLAKHNMD